MEVMQQHFQKRGLAPRLLRGIFQPSMALETDLISFSRVCPISHLNSGRYNFPRTMLLHAQDDVSVPCQESEEMAKYTSKSENRFFPLQIVQCGLQNIF